MEDSFLQKELAGWPLAQKNYEALRGVCRKDFVQFNPARIVSTGASIDKESIRKRPCFLCSQNRPAEQHSLPIAEHYELLVNPFPILPEHFTIASLTHEPQRIRTHFADMQKMVGALPEYIVFYNGPVCGASCPDHLHFQSGSKGIVPLQRDWSLFAAHTQRIVEGTAAEATPNTWTGISLLPNWPVFVIESDSAQEQEALFMRLYDVLPVAEGEEEPRMNLLCWMEGNHRITLLFPRSKHRPECYYAQGEAQRLISPGALDMAGLLITPRREDFERLDAKDAARIIQEVSLSPQQIEDVVKAIQNEY